MFCVCGWGPSKREGTQPGSFRWRESEASFEQEVKRLLKMHRDRERDPSVTPEEVQKTVKAFEGAYRQMRSWKPN